MDKSLLEMMKEASAKKEPMTPRTVRFGKELDDDLHAFANEHDLDFSVVVRTMAILGWKVFNDK